MIRTLSSNEAKQQWGSIMNAVGNNGDEVIVESHGKPKVVVIPFDEFEAFQKARKEQIRAEALVKFDALSARLGKRNGDLTQDQIDDLANRFVHEMYEDLVRDDKVGIGRAVAEDPAGDLD